MATVTLIQLWPFVAATGAVEAVRIAGGGSRPYSGYLGFADWRQGLIDPVRFTTSVGFDESGWTAEATPKTGALSIGSSDAALRAKLAAYYWVGAAVTVSVGDDAVGAPAFSTQLVGTIAGASVAGGVLQLTIADLSGSSAPIASSTFAGSGGIEGGSDAIGRVKRRSWGRVFNVEGKLLDKANNIYEFGDPSVPLNSFQDLRDKGRSAVAIAVVSWQGSVAATLSALQASAPASGGGAVAPSIACAKWWTQPAGPLTADLWGEIGAGYVDTAPDIAQRVATLFGGLTITNAAAFASLRPWKAGLHCDSATETVAQALDRLLLGIHLTWILDPTGTIALREFTWAGPVETIISRQVSRTRLLPPLGTRTLGYQRNHRIQSDGEIAFIEYASAPLLYLSAQAQAYTYDGDGAPLPADQSISFTANLQNVSGTATFTAKAYGSDGSLLGDVGVSGSSNTRTIDTAINLKNAYPTWTTIVVTASLGGLADTVTIVRLANGSSAVTPYLTNENATFAAATDGTVGDYSPANGTFKVFKGSTDVSSAASFVVVSSTAGIGATISSTGAYSVSAMSIDNGTVTLRATYAGANYLKILTLSKSKQGLKGNAGDAGPAGYNNAVVTLFKRGAFAPAGPSQPTTYTFSTGILSDPGNGWVQNIALVQGTGDLYAVQASAVSVTAQDAIAANEWSGAAIYSANGLSTATIFAYRRAAAQPTTPPSSTNYTFATGAITLDNGWSREVPGSDGNPCWVIQATASASTTTDVILNTEWSSAAKLVQDGPPGLANTVVTLFKRGSTAPAGPNQASTYTFSTGILGDPGNGWVQNISLVQGTGPYLYAVAATASSSGPQDSIAANEWSSPVQITANGIDGLNGANGLNIVSIFAYKRSATQPTTPPSTANYTFSTNSITLDNGWARQIPTSDGNACWVIQSTAAAVATSDTDQIASGEWSSAAKLVQDGLSGYTTAIVTLYKRATSVPSGPNNQTTYTFASASITTPGNGWTQAIPSGTGDLYAVQASAVAQGASDTIETNEWSGATILGANGANGLNTATVYGYKRAASMPTTPPSDATYTFASSSISLNNGWATSIPSSNGFPCWVIQATASSTGPSDVITSGEWSAAAKLVQDGMAGAAGANGNDGLGSANRVRFSLFERGTTGWANPYLSAGATVNTPLYTGVFFGIPAVVAKFNTSGVGVASLGNAVTNSFVVSPGERLAVVVGLQAYGAVDYVLVRVFFQDIDGNLDSGVNGQLVGQEAGQHFYNQRIGGFITVPAGNLSTGKKAASARVEAYAQSTGTTVLDMALSQVMVTEAAQNQTILPNFSAGPSSEAGATVGAPPGTYVGDPAVPANLADNIAATAKQGGAFAADVADNSKFSKDEKKRYVQLVNNWNSASGVSAIVSQLNALGLTAQATSLNTAWSNFFTYLQSVAYSDLSTTTTIVRTTFLAYEKAFQDALTAAGTAVQNLQGSQIRTAQNVFSDPRFDRLPGSSGITSNTAEWSTVSVPSSGAEDSSDGRRLRCGGAVYVATNFVSVSAGDQVDAAADIFLDSTFNGSVQIWAHFKDNFNGSDTYQNVFNFDANAISRSTWWNNQSGRTLVPSSASYMRLYIQTTQSQGTAWVRQPKGFTQPTSLQGTAYTTSGSYQVSAISFSAIGQNSVTLNAFLCDFGSGYIYISGGTISGLSASTTYFLWLLAPNLKDDGRSFSVSTSFIGNTDKNRIFIGSFVTAGTGGGGGSVGGGGGGNTYCVAADAFLEDGLRAGSVAPGMMIDLMKLDGTGLERGEVRSVVFAEVECVHLIAASGAEVVCSLTTPMERQDGSLYFAPHALNEMLFVDTDGVPGWEPCVEVRPAGSRPVARIDVGGRVYLAGSIGRRRVATHNVQNEKP